MQLSFMMAHICMYIFFRWETADLFFHGKQYQQMAMWYAASGKRSHHFQQVLNIK